MILHYEWAVLEASVLRAAAHGVRGMNRDRMILHVKHCEELERMRLYEWQ